jgi:hypothetical protein
MSAPAIGLRSRVLPSPSAHIDTTSPYGVGMIAALVPAYGLEMVSGRTLVRGSAIAYRPTAWGASGEQTANSTPGWYVDVGAYPARMSYVIVAHKLSGTSTRQGLALFNNASAGSESGTQGFACGFSGSSGNGFDSAVGSNGDTYSLLHIGTAWRFSTLSVPDGPVVIGGVRNTAGTTLVPYVNGVAGTGVTLGTAPTGTLTVTAGTSTVTRSSAANVCATAAILVWDRELSAREMADLAADPFQMFRQ